MSSEENACGCGALTISAEVFKGFPTDVRVMQVLRVVPGMFTEKRNFLEIVKIAALLPTLKEIVSIIKEKEREMDRLDWAEYCEGIKNCIKIFGLPEEKIAERVEDAVLKWAEEERIDTWSDSWGRIKLLKEEFHIPREKILQNFVKAMDQEIKEHPLECITVAGKINVSIKPWDRFFMK